VALAALLACLSLAVPARPVRDDTGKAVEIPDAPCRIVSLAPGTTAML
jgi:ABC-type Fe3+-hydroxamate transport system substrate-binding protein